MSAGPETPPPREGRQGVFDRSFWLAYAANGVSVTAFAMHFRFADFVDFLGGSATVIGLIWGIGMVGAALARLFVGWHVDHRGLRWPWVSSALVLFATSAGFVLVERVGPLIYLLRVVFSLALAAQFCCVVAFVWRGVPIVRRAEALGLMGTSGFIGMTVGPQISDALLSLPLDPATNYKLMFSAAAALALIDVLIACYAVSIPSAAWSTHQRTVGLWRVLRAYWPRGAMPATLVMGVTQTVHFTFLTRFVQEIGLSGVGPFFAVYAVWALIVRVLGRKLPERLGLERAIVVSIALLAVSSGLLATVDSLAGIILVAFIAGTGHAIIFPCTTALGASYFPLEYTVTGLAVTLSLVDLANVICSPVLGLAADLLGFRAMFLVASATVALAGVSFALAHLHALRTGLAASRIGVLGSDRREKLPRLAFRRPPDEPLDGLSPGEEL